MSPRAPKNDGQDGFILIEVLVSALILAIVGGAVLTLIVATTRGAATQGGRSVASDLAQADQARLRTLRISEVNGVQKEVAHPKSNGTEYTVVSERVYINNKAGAVSCSKGTETPDYVQLTSTVSSPTMVRPLVLQSVVSPSTGSLNPNYGTFDFPTSNALGEPVSGVTITLAGGKSATTGTEGCAIFPSLPKATYTVLYEGRNLINEEGKSTWSESLEIVPGQVKSPESPLRWDRPATLKPEFVYVEPVTGTLRPAPVDSMYVVNATSGKPATVIGNPGVTARNAIQVDPAVFPFKSPSEYTVYAGSCTTNNPGTVGANTEGIYSAVVPPAAILTPQIHVPALEVTVTTKSGPEGKTGVEQILPGATVTLTDLKCKSSGANVKRTFTTNAKGHLSSAANGPTEAGVPFGAYKVCASITMPSGEIRRAEQSEVKVENFTAGTTQKPGGTILPLSLQKGSAC
jgi:type II secretory pathway pseudopilin PulG